MFIARVCLVFFGITLPAVRIAGAGRSHSAGSCCTTAVDPRNKRSSVATSQPTVIDSVLSADDAAHGRPGVDRGGHRLEAAARRTLLLSHLTLLGGSVIAIVALTLTVWVCYRFAKRTVTLLGENGVMS